MARLRYLTSVDVEFIAHRLAAKLFSNYADPLPAIELFGGLREGGGLLESALGLPRQPYYRTLHDKAGALLRSLIKNHPLVDGNKRVGMTATVVFLVINGHILLASNDEMVRFALDLAASEPDMDWREVATWLRARTIRLDISEAELRTRLTHVGQEQRLHLAATVHSYARAFTDLAEELREGVRVNRTRR